MAQVNNVVNRNETLFQQRYRAWLQNKVSEATGDQQAAALLAGAFRLQELDMIIKGFRQIQTDHQSFPKEKKTAAVQRKVAAIMGYIHSTVSQRVQISKSVKAKLLKASVVG